MNVPPLLHEAPRWQVMWLLAFAIYAGAKLLSWRARRVDSAPPWRHAAYLLAWPGMDADAFLRQAVRHRPPAGEWAFAAIKLVLGAVMFVVAGRLAVDTQVAPRLAGWLGMVALVFFLHFGVFHVLSCGWRAAGVEATPIMRWPIVSTSVAEFWGRRWNLAFRDLSHRFVFRPLRRRIGAPLALMAGFVVSGVVHDLVISVPAGGGWGWPTAYFVLNGLAILAERSRPGRRLGLGRGVIGWCFTVAVLLLPVTWLLHGPFVLDVIVPFLTYTSF